MTSQQAKDVAGEVFDLRKRVYALGWCDPSECGWCDRKPLCDALGAAESAALKIANEKERKEREASDGK